MRGWRHISEAMERAAFGGDELLGAGTAVMQYTGHSEYTESDPPTYVCVGENDGIASWRTGTVAEGWIEDMVAFLAKHM